MTITFSGVGVATTDASGHYSMTVPYRWSGTATASFSSGGFSVNTKTYILVTAKRTGQDYIWLPPHTISGKIKNASSGIGIAGVQILFSNGGGTVTTDSQGNYSIVVAYGWSGTATPSGGLFCPLYKKFNMVITDLTSQNFSVNKIWEASRAVSGKVTANDDATVGVVQQSAPATVTTTTGFAQWALLHGLVGNPAVLFDQIADARGITYGAQYAFGANLALGDPLMRLLLVTGVLTAEMPTQDPATLVDARVMVEFTSHEGSAIWFPAVCLPPLAPTPITKQWFQAGYGDAADFRVTVQFTGGQ